jgi:hypothetical protein
VAWDHLGSLEFSSQPTLEYFCPTGACDKMKESPTCHKICIRPLLFGPPKLPLELGNFSEVPSIPKSS